MNHTTSLRFLLPMLVFCCYVPVRAASGNHVKVAVIGDVPRITKNKDTQNIVEQVIDFWKRQLAQVLPDKPDLVVLPEACDRPAGLSAEEQFNYYAARKDQVKDFFSSVAKENHCYIAFGTKHQDAGGNWLNSIYVLDRNGSVAGVYDKNFPTIGEMESGIKAGHEVPVIGCDFGRVACAICFDLNFTGLLARYQEAKPDIILFSSMYHGGMMQNYWAYSCRSFFVGAIGGRSTPSEIRNPLGEVVASTTNYFNFAVADINLDCRLVHLDYNWGKLTKLKEKYGDAVSIRDPGQLGSVLVSGENDHITVDQMLDEFEIELLDGYFDRSREFRLKPGNMK